MIVGIIVILISSSDATAETTAMTDSTTSLSEPIAGSGYPKTISEARRIAWPSGVRPRGTDAPYRAVSVYFSYVLGRTFVSPNQITVFWVAIGLLGVVALGSPNYWYRVAGAVLLEVSYLFDFVDGEVARLQGRSSNRGFFLDLLGHSLIKTALFLGIGYREYLISHRPVILILSFTAATAISGWNYLPIFASHASVVRKSSFGGGESARQMSSVRSWIGIPFESPGLYGIVLLACLARQLVWVVIAYGIIAPIWLLIQISRYRDP